MMSGNILYILKAFQEVGSGGGLRKGRIWLLLNNSTKETKQSCLHDLTIHEQLGIDRPKSEVAFGRQRRKLFESEGVLGCGRYTLRWKNSLCVTVHDKDTDISKYIDLPQSGFPVQRGSEESKTIKAAIDFSLYGQAEGLRPCPVCTYQEEDRDECRYEDAPK